jgi:hypothetical protein
MKTWRNAALLILLTAGFAQAQNITVSGEKKPNADFRKYKTFGWERSDKPGKHLVAYTYEEFTEPVSSNASYPEKNRRKRDRKDKDVVLYSYTFTVPSGDSIVNHSLKLFVDDEMEGRGYRKDMENPDLLIAYTVFDHSTQMKGYTSPPTPVGSQEIYTPEDTITYKLKPGTVLITMVDAKNGSVVWEGYASGVARPSDAINDKLRVKEAINLIFKKFQYRADKYSMN